MHELTQLENSKKEERRTYYLTLEKKYLNDLMY